MTVQNTITEVINSVLASEGINDREPRAARVVEQVSGRLVQTLNTGVNAVVQAAVSDGISEDRARQAFVTAGLVDAPAPVVEESTSDDDRLGKIESTLARLVELAQQRLGVRI